MNETHPGEESNQLIDDENNRESKLFESQPDAAAGESLLELEPESDINKHVEEGIGEENEENLENLEEHEGTNEGEGGVKEENVTGGGEDQSLNESDSILETTNVESESGGANQSGALNDSQEIGRDYDKKESEMVYQKKDTIKRKARQQNRFADGNLILEEDDNQVQHFFV